MFIYVIKVKDFQHIFIKINKHYFIFKYLIIPVIIYILYKNQLVIDYYNFMYQRFEVLKFI